MLCLSLPFCNAYKTSSIIHCLFATNCSSQELPEGWGVSYSFGSLGGALTFLAPFDPSCTRMGRILKGMKYRWHHQISHVK